MTHVCILLHGIETDPQTRSWTEEVQARYQRITPIQLIPRKYGYVSGLQVWANAFARKEAVDHEEAYFRGVEGQLTGLFEDLEPGTLVSVVGHSLGGYIITALLKRGLKFHRIAHIWGATVSNFNWQAVEGNFDRVRVIWSPKDEILQASSVGVGEDPELALGLLGKEGPSILHPRVESIKTDWTHNQFMDLTPERDKLWKNVFEWIITP